MALKVFRRPEIASNSCRLQTDTDRQRAVEAVASEGGIAATEPSELDETIKRLAPRWFVMRNLHRSPSLLQSRTTLCWLRGPMTRDDVRRLARSAAPASQTTR